MGLGSPLHNCQNLDSDLFDTIYDTGTHFKCYKTSLHLQDLENQQDCTSECLYFNFLGNHATKPLYSFQKKIVPLILSKLAMALILCMTHASV